MTSDKNAPYWEQDIAECLRVAAEIIGPNSYYLRAAEYIDELRAECERLREQVYVPGIWRCAKCELELMTSILAVSSGSIHADNSPQVCPNNCGPMWRVTERDQRKEAQALHEKEFLRAQAAEAREREAYERAAKEADNHECGGPDDIICQHQNCGMCIAASIRALGERREG